MIETDDKQGKENIMKKVDADMGNELRPEYDLKSLWVRKVGPKRRSFGEQSIQLELDVAGVFPDSKIRSLNENTKC